MTMTRATARMTAQIDPLEVILESFAAATPELLGKRALMTRIDSKFVVPVASLDPILGGLSEHYAIIHVDSGTAATYESLYFDTPSLRCFHDHRTGRRLRHKIRIRHYPDRHLSFLEIKTKRNADRTEKRRLEIPFGEEHLGPGELEFLYTHIGEMAGELRPQITIAYKRISMIALGSDERVTIDLGLSASGEAGPVVARALGHLAVLEIKQWPYCVRTPIMRAVRGAGYRVMSMSKYVTALALTRPDLRCNRLRPALRALERI